MSYVKLFSDILASTIWATDNQTRIVWITMLAMANMDGEVGASVPGLAHIARVSVEECEQALSVLLSPDPHSRTKSDDGRRIRPIEGGWLILNYEAHRDRFTIHERREKDRLRQERKRGRDMSRSVTLVTPGHAASHKVPHSEAEAEAEAEASPPEKVQSTSRPDRSRQREERQAQEERFVVFWRSYDHMHDRAKAWKAWLKLSPTMEQACAITQKAMDYVARKRAEARAEGREDENKFVKLPATWLNGRCWEDDKDAPLLPMAAGARKASN